MQIPATVNLPSPPQTAFRLIELCRDTEVDIKDIVNILSLDVALAAKLLRVANSAYYGQQYEVSTLSRAAVVLGLEYVKVVALAFQLAELSKHWSDIPLDLRCLWQGAVIRACLARQLAAQSATTVRLKEEAFLVGLLQDYAVPLYAREMGVAYAEQLGGGGLFTRIELLPLEQQALGRDHAQMASKLFELWRFPPLLTVAMANHHVPPESTTSLEKNTILWQIAYWVGAIPFNDNQRTAPVAAELRRFAQSAFGLDTEALAIAFYQAIEDYEAVRPIFDGVLPADVGGSSMIREAQSLIATIGVKDVAGPFTDKM